MAPLNPALALTISTLRYKPTISLHNQQQATSFAIPRSDDDDNNNDDDDDDDDGIDRRVFKSDIHEEASDVSLLLDQKVRIWHYCY